MCLIGTTQTLILRGILTNNSTIMEGGDNILKTAFGQYKDALKADFNTGFEKLMKQDKYTTREYLRQEM